MVCFVKQIRAQEQAYYEHQAVTFDSFIETYMYNYAWTLARMTRPIVNIVLGAVQNIIQFKL